jgi:hypothetical protein
MDDRELTELRRVVGLHEKLVYEAIKRGRVAEPIPMRGRCKNILHLKRVHAVEFADVREGVQYEITVQGETMNPMAHVATHAAVKEQIEEDPLVRTAFENMVATTTSDPHAEHGLAAMLMEAPGHRSVKRSRKSMDDLHTQI